MHVANSYVIDDYFINLLWLSALLFDVYLFVVSNGNANV